MATFSIIVPTYNRAELLQQTLASIQCQLERDYEVIVVDDGSSDGTAGVLELNPWVKSYSIQHRGPGAARNHAASKSTGRYLAFLDSDDLWFPWSLAIYRDAIRQSEDPSFIAGKPYLFTDPSVLARVEATAMRTHRFPNYLESADQWRWFGVSSFVVRADAFDRSGGFVETSVNGEDADLALKLGEFDPRSRAPIQAERARRTGATKS
jgi:glycosyltransferase involved in cell wall biosynthesis